MLGKELLEAIERGYGGDIAGSKDERDLCHALVGGTTETAIWPFARSRTGRRRRNAFPFISDNVWISALQADIRA